VNLGDLGVLAVKRLSQNRANSRAGCGSIISSQPEWIGVGCDLRQVGPFGWTFPLVFLIVTPLFAWISEIPVFDDGAQRI
jgi:hypothetical protein